jgi:hypothetical protein
MATNAPRKIETSAKSHDWTLLNPDDQERIRLSGLSITEQYGESYRAFDWSYWVIASPVPSRKGSRTRRSQGNNDDAIKGMLAATFRDLEVTEWNMSSPTDASAVASKESRRLRYVYCLETGSEGWRHAHILLGSISRLDSFHVETAFKAHKFGYVLVRVWNRRLENGYPFKSLAPSSSDYREAYPDSNVTWNRKCKQEMKLHRKHLLRWVGPYASNERIAMAA